MRHCQSQRLQIISVTLPWRISYTAHLCSNTLHNYHSYSATYWNLLQWLWQPFLSTFVWSAQKVQRNQGKALNHPCRSYQLWSGDHDPGLCHNTFLNFVVTRSQVSHSDHSQWTTMQTPRITSDWEDELLLIQDVLLTWHLDQGQWDSVWSYNWLCLCIEQWCWSEIL